MIKAIAAFVILFLWLVGGRLLWQSMSRGEKWSLTKIVFRSIITSVIVIAILFAIVVLF